MWLDLTLQLASGLQPAVELVVDVAVILLACAMLFEHVAAVPMILEAARLVQAAPALLLAA